MDGLASDIGDLHSRLLSTLEAAERRLVDAAAAAPPKRSRTYGFEDIGGPAKAALSAIAALPPERASLASRTVIANLLTRNLSKLLAAPTPRVAERTAQTLGWMVPWLGEAREERYAYPDDFFLKDYRFATGMTVPCGAQVVDLAERPGYKSLISASLQRPAKAVAMFGKSWFRPHTESRYLDEFNEDGWNRCYAEIVDLLHARPEVVGMVATSWFYDPQLTSISPRLAYLRKVPADNGAITVAHGTSEFDIQSATATSPTRRTLYEQGQYRPTCWSIMWLREDMIAWRRRNPGV